MVPKRVWCFDPQEQWNEEWKATVKPEAPKQSNMPLLMAWLPYVLIAALLIVTRIPGLGLKQSLQQGVFLIKSDNLFGVENTAFTLKWAYVPGTAFILVALITVFLHKMKATEVKNAWIASLKQVGGAAVALVFGMALVQIMRYSGANELDDPGIKSMIFYMAEALSKVGSVLYVIFAPVIGILGAFISGSNTVAVTLFSNLQYQAASNLGLNTVLIVAANTIGGSLGNMLCINSIVSTCATAGTTGKEGSIIRINLIPTAIYTVLVIGIMAFALWGLGL